MKAIRRTIRTSGLNNSPASASLFFQPKLTINQPNDIYEQEADAMADNVMRMKEPSAEEKFFPPPSVRRKCADCESSSAKATDDREEDKKIMQRKESNTEPTEASAETENYLSSLSGGRSLSEEEKDFYEPGMGADLSNVRIYTDNAANESAKNVNALAYTHGNDIVFGSGQYHPGTTEGNRLLAHELTHVVQQSGPSSIANIQRDVGWARSASGKPYGDALTKDTNQKITETISNAPEAYKQWNLTTWWYSKFQVAYDLNTNTVTAIVKLNTSADASTKSAWEKAIESKWSKKYKIQELNSEGKEISKKDILIDVQWVDDKKDAHYVINPTKAGDTRDGRAGVAGTTSMTDWGVKDTVDVTHEFGHMLGNTEEYFTTNGVDYTKGGKKQGWWDKGGGVMNNPSEDPAPRHYELIRKSVVALLEAEDKNVKVI